ncbi:MAG: hypothetical protein E6J40_06405 [Chloroflexi bacterium]|nr:MAG: hypothetical protein E6J40_06405 [Chloroflexota bacterium]
MSKRTTTRAYISAWVVYVISAIALIMALRNNDGTASVPPVAIDLYLVILASVVVMLVFWIGALIRLGQMHAWAWFTAVLVLHLIGLGIAGMVAYAIGGPDDSMFVVTRRPMAT